MGQPAIIYNLRVTANATINIRHQINTCIYFITLISMRSGNNVSKLL